ncbi:MULTISPECIES: energy-coupling factor transporter transmembrane component T family protein [unclassified Enterococcus]|uniref:energy-coupling factor transporter transmembrane component T family protein n=1 Tax=unclassified Enterococcus TaxID=2608891 RepID=UPI001CE1E89F|nr:MULTISPECIES: energy-coupling factor transporter transmembrane component T [unclassified Enterococcus]MCA5013127.1 energy-coupling factor transporter transmembrane protein EcfT [Enterococcus sp. S23]MCA5016377.1 energy-coupling factor transporter transmembrane protein EcfT [Enterococcus sp. S22(2020)]
MNEHQMLGYIPDDTVVHKINGTAKLIFLILLSVACMTTYDTRFLLGMTVFSLILFKFSHIKWHQISFVVKFIFVFSLLNIIAVYLFSPEYGVELYGSKTLIWQGFGRFTITQEQLFYEFNLVLKYFCTIPLVLIFLLTTNPSEFASSLNRIGVSYKISYAVALAIRYIPDIQEDFINISLTQQARGFEMSKKGKLSQRLKGTAQIVFPLILSSLDRIETISTAMELRRFGEKKKRTWYAQQPFHFADIVVIGLALILTALSFALFKVNGGRFYNPF